MDEEVGVRLTKWGVIAPGEGGNRITSLFFSTRNNQAIERRILLLNTTTADIEKVIEDIGGRVSDERAKELLKEIRDHNVQTFGERGAGNFWPEGEEYIKRDFDGDERVRRKIDAVRLGECAAIFDVFTLGGGTGCGSAPYTIYRTRKDEITGAKHFAIAVWPEEIEGGQRHFNAIGGLSRLLKYEGEQNADLVILISNEYLAKSISEDKGEEDRYFVMNNMIADLIELMIAPGRSQSDVTIEISDYATWAAAVRVYHAVPCLSIGNDVEIIGIEAALDDAVSKALFPMDAKTATIVWAIFRVPQDYYGVDEFKPRRIRKIFDSWAKEHIIGEVKYVAVTYDRNLKETFDVLLLLGGPTIDITKSYQKYEKFKKALSRGSENIILPGRGGKIIVPVKTFDTLEKNLNDYLRHTEEVQETLGEKEL